jgi:glycosyltransferase involved in cell wall biosynthesis
MPGALAKLLDSPPARERLGREAVERVKRYSLPAMIDGTLAVYNKALSKQARNGEQWE